MELDPRKVYSLEEVIEHVMQSTPTGSKAENQYSGESIKQFDDDSDEDGNPFEPIESDSENEVGEDNHSLDIFSLNEIDCIYRDADELVANANDLFRPNVSFECSVDIPHKDVDKVENVRTEEVPSDEHEGTVDRESVIDFRVNPENQTTAVTPPAPPAPCAASARRKGLKSSANRAAVNRKVRPPCKCKMNCISSLNEERRTEINKQYWTKCWQDRACWMKSMTDPEPVKRKRPRKHSGSAERSMSCKYFLHDKQGQRVRVCRLFFLNTLGVSNKVVVNMFRNSNVGDMFSPDDKRGTHPPKHKMTEETTKAMKDHINSYNPSVSHYRQKHAPKRRYLPPSLNASVMHKDFILNDEFNDVHYISYLQQILKMKISFTKLGEEECEQCLEQTEHHHRESTRYKGTKGISDLMNSLINDVECRVTSCETCSEYEKHMERANISRSEYRNDANLYKPSDAECVAAVDMQKVIMLPRMPGVKRAVFTRRIVAFNMTFAPLLGRKGGRPVAVIWHEAMCGRNDEDVTSFYAKYLNAKRDCERVTLWADNCSAQNKNWTLFTILCKIVNDPLYSFNEITIKYFEPGHTFMAADAFHKIVEDEMKKKGMVLDFTDFKECMDAKGIALEMTHEDFYDYKSKLSQHKGTNYPYLDEVAEVQFRRGSTKMYWKSDMRLVDYSDGEFLQKKFLKVWHQNNIFARKTCPRGIPEKKKEDILRKLCPMMPKSRCKFWEDLQVARVVDLIDQYEE